MDQFQASLGARLYRALEWDGVPSNTSQLTNLHIPRPDEGSRRTNRDVPSKAVLGKLGLKFLIGRSLDVEEGQDGGDVEEKGLDSEMFTGTAPVRGKISVQWKVKLDRGEGVRTFYLIRRSYLRDP